MNPEEKLQSLISSSNATTGISDDTLTDAVQSLCDGYGHSSSPYPDEYVTDGLTAWYDAINNTRSGHDASATTWEDLSGNGYDLKLSLGNAPIVGNNFMYFYGGRLSSDSVPATTDDDYPRFVEIVLQTTPTSTVRYVAGLPNNGFGTTFQRSTQIGFQLLAENAGATVLPNVDDEMQSVYAARNVAIGKNAGWSLVVSSSEGWRSGEKISVGAYIDLNQYVFIGYICAYRLYNKILSLEERLQNFEQDKKRFGIDGSGIGLAELFNALPTLPTGTSKAIKVSSTQLAEASADTIVIATGKGWTVA